jgi:hypothetical protein
MRSTVGSAWVLLGALFTSLGLRRGGFQRRLRHTGHPLRRVSPAASSPSSVTPPGWWRLPRHQVKKARCYGIAIAAAGVLVAAVLLVSVVGTPLPTGISVVAALAFVAVVAWPLRGDALTYQGKSKAASVNRVGVARGRSCVLPCLLRTGRPGDHSPWSPTMGCTAPGVGSNVGTIPAAALATAAGLWPERQTAGWCREASRRGRIAISRSCSPSTDRRLRQRAPPGESARTR